MVDYYLDSQVFTFDLKTQRLELQKLYDNLSNNIKRVKYIEEIRLFTAKEIVKIDLSYGSKKFVRLFMRADNLYIIGYTLVPGPLVQDDIQELYSKGEGPLLYKSEWTGQNYDYGDLAHLKMFNHTTIRRAFDNLCKPKPSGKTIKDSLEVFMILYAEGSRFEWIASRLIKIVQKPSQANLLENHLVDILHSWGTWTDYSRHVDKGANYTNPELAKKYEDQDYELFTADPDKDDEVLRRNVTAEKVVVIKRLKHTDFDENNNVDFERHLKKTKVSKGHLAWSKSSSGQKFLEGSKPSSSQNFLEGSTSSGSNKGKGKQKKQ